MGIGTNLTRVDAVEKVTGAAKYVGDLEPKDALVAKVVRSTIANGVVKRFDLSEALKVTGVVKIVTCFDVPDYQFPTPGHPWSTEKAHQDVADRKILNTRVRVYGDDIGAVVAENEVAANQAVRLIKVEYEEHEPILSIEQAMAPGADVIHEEHPDNIIGHSSFKLGEGTYEEAAKEDGLILLEKEYQTQPVQHCHIEVPHSFAYMEKDRIIVVSSTQIPHIVRRVIGQALGIPWGKIRVIKPYIGGGFGNKQDVLYEPLNAYLCTQVGGRCVKLELTREETLACTRTRHAIKYKIQAAVRKDGQLVARSFKAYSNQGAYASHGHAIAANGANLFKQMYHDERVLESESFTVYTNCITAGAMRAYGIPQGAFATECMIDDLALKLQMDPLEFRLKNCMRPGYIDPHTKITCFSYGLDQCIDIGRKHIKWEEKRKEYASQTGTKRRGVGMSIFCYKTGVYPISLETASCRMILNQDGSIQLQMGATEIGQGADTVFTQMASEVTGITEDNVHIITVQDTDITPFDTGAYASRQCYVSGMALKKTGKLLKEKILNYAQYMLNQNASTMDIINNEVIEKETGKKMISLADLAEEAFYSLDHCEHITAEATSQCKDNTFATGACFVEVEVDIPYGAVEILNIINVHDSGTLLNPKLAKAQVHGGMSMGLGYALGEELLYGKDGRPLNNNLLDYKMPTAMDTPQLDTGFVEIEDPTGPFGNKALGEPPAIPQAPAVRNAILNATGVAFDTLPLNPEKLVLGFMEHGLIERKGENNNV